MGRGGGRGEVAAAEDRVGLVPAAKRPPPVTLLYCWGGGEGRGGQKRKGGGEEDGREGQILDTGLTLNRSQRGAALLRTRPVPRIRSSTGDLAPVFQGQMRRCRGRPEGRGARFGRRPAPGAVDVSGRCSPSGAGGRAAIEVQPERVRRGCVVPSRRDSGLEAFSHNPTDGSLAPVAPQPSTRTKCLNLRFLSY